MLKLDPKMTPKIDPKINISKMTKFQIPQNGENDEIPQVIHS